jgi:esterase/lipase superfamily enzyme
VPVTVYFATNRVVSGAPENWQSYGTDIVAPSDPGAITYGTAFVEDAGLTADTTGAIRSIQEVSKGGFGASPTGDLSAAGRNLLIFIHGFDNSFENAITRAAYNQQWLAASGLTGADTTVVAFTWPSLGQLLSFPVPWADYLQDQTMGGQSGLHLSSFFLGLQPIIRSARNSGSRIFLIAHSMGNWALQAAVESWFAHGNAGDTFFDEIVLAAADERYDTFGFPLYGRLSGLNLLAKRVSVYFSRVDAVLQLSMTVNLGAQRLGQQGPQHMSDVAQFPPNIYRMVDCTSFDDYDRDFASSHQYYRRSPGVRADIAKLFSQGA